MDEKDYSIIDLENAIFVVNEKPYCFWDFSDIKKSNLNFIDGLDPSFSEYLGYINYSKFQTKKGKQKAALALRLTYSMGLEALFALLFAAIQAPHCIAGWLHFYKFLDLQEISKKIDLGLTIPSVLTEPRLSWLKVSNFIFQYLVLEDKEKEKKIKNQFSYLWSRLAHDFQNDKFRKEFNCIKHGIRVKQGGFSFSVRPSDKTSSGGVVSKNHLLGQSEFGSAFLDVQKINGRAENYQFQSVYCNWNPEDFYWRLCFISLSMRNIICTLKILNGINPKKVKYEWPNTDTAFDEPFKRTSVIGVSSFTSSGFKVDQKLVDKFGDINYLEAYEKGKFLQRRKIKIMNDPM